MDSFEHILTQFKTVALEAVEKASIVVKPLNRNVALSKSVDLSPVTLADYVSQLIINYHLKSLELSFAIYSEEDFNDYMLLSKDSQTQIIDLFNSAMGLSIRHKDVEDLLNFKKAKPDSTQDFKWTIDPIDGTKGYIRNQQYCVCVSLIYKDEVVLGVIGAPNLNPNNTNFECKKNEDGIVIYAEKNKGTFMRNLNSLSEFIKINTSKKTNIEDCLLCQSVDKNHGNKGLINTFMSQCNPNLYSNKIVEMDSQCKYLIVAMGLADIYLRVPLSVKNEGGDSHYVEKVWDHAPGYLIVKEAGGIVSDINGNDLVFNVGKRLEKNKGIIAANNSTVHQNALKILRKLLTKL